MDLTFSSIMRDLDKIISQIQEVSALTEEVSTSLSLVYHSK
ncbi:MULTISPECIES: chemotaxis protein [Bacillus]|nr:MULTISPECIES: chemotaxis protein [Bacillus cereus group]MDA1532337.1 chemotaxis protein [Bacillus cereus group sp. TH254-2LC]MDA1544226.1 chemotaxis protein [Bacillus cereus group sp. TH253LC]MDA1579294.1 chemotaxis protein [Bacillus cereus group sp. TH228LC]MDA1627619.1 chemotaxis protein [Bacillus cereus group sp. TH172LC]MDA1836938.1 chemotaxis protein [Bacillus cereus group sp. BY17LC]